MKKSLETRFQSALKRKKISNRFLLPIGIGLIVIHGIFPDIPFVDKARGIFSILYLVLLFSWIFVKCPKCGQFYFGTWQGTKEIKHGCKVCGTQEFLAEP
jgi:hypothetical protein